MRETNQAADVESVLGEVQAEDWTALSEIEQARISQRSLICLRKTPGDSGLTTYYKASCEVLMSVIGHAP